MKREYWYIIGGIAAGVVGTAVVVANKEKLKPMAATLVAKAMTLKEKALDCAARTKEHAEDIVAEARHINEVADAQPVKDVKHTHKAKS